MQSGRVVGTATATVKHPSMEGYKLLIVQPYLADGKTPDGDPVIAVGGLGAGLEETVIITSDGRGAREMLGVEATPVRWTVIGLCDE